MLSILGSGLRWNLPMLDLYVIHQLLAANVYLYSLPALVNKWILTHIAVVTWTNRPAPEDSELDWLCWFEFFTVSRHLLYDLHHVSVNLSDPGWNLGWNLISWRDPFMSVYGLRSWSSWVGLSCVLLWKRGCLVPRGQCLQHWFKRFVGIIISAFCSSEIPLASPSSRSLPLLLIVFLILGLYWYKSLWFLK